ncbi:sugar phosphate isomerase/epimerase family protein [Candidatus Nitrosocosmicus hydrocola]|uniref:sugar phosphate isomerase/epimerase family protein n=1 Tax=Candidatus Nitrosocosmicus hydrocola TaxID=1826872 RepID=UPI0011E5DF9E|nr:sugar phosphate isomerase/epimerase family protein [Candidatus Nitrosocosmicus hydrocola]
MTFSYSITLSSFLKLQKDFKLIFDDLVHAGFSNVEMFGEPDETNRLHFKDLLSVHNIHVTGVTGMWGKSSINGWKRRLLSNDPSMVKCSVDYIFKCIELCNYFGGNKINICLLSDPINYLDVTHNNVREKEKSTLLEKCIPVLKKLSLFAKDYDVELVIEPLNRYSTPYCCNYQDALIILKNCPDVQLMLDTFHMNIEEDSFSKIILQADSRLAHIHFADNNRKMPGEGHIDFKEIVRSLKKISYNGYVSFEPILSDPDFGIEVKSGLDFIKNLELA